MTGWKNYYGISEMKGFMNDLNGWLKRRIRQYIWRQWKNPQNKCRNLIQLGIESKKPMNGQTPERVTGEFPPVTFL